MSLLRDRQARLVTPQYTQIWYETIRPRGPDLQLIIAEAALTPTKVSRQVHCIFLWNHPCRSRDIPEWSADLYKVSIKATPVVHRFGETCPMGILLTAQSCFFAAEVEGLRLSLIMNSLNHFFVEAGHPQGCNQSIPLHMP